jgi:hypothetical protein
MRQFVIFVDPPVLPRLAQIEAPRGDQTAAVGVETIPRQPGSIASANGVAGAAAASTRPEARVVTEPSKAAAQELTPATPRPLRPKRNAPPSTELASLNLVDGQEQKSAARPPKVVKKSSRQTPADVASASDGRLQLQAVKITPIKPMPEAASSASTGAATAVAAPAASVAQAAAPAASAASTAVAASSPDSIPAATLRSEAQRSNGGMPTLRTLWQAAREGSVWPLLFALISLLLMGGVVHIWRLPGLQARRRSIEGDRPSRLPVVERSPAAGSGPAAAERKLLKPAKAGKSAATPSAQPTQGLLKDEPHRALASGLQVHEHTQAFVSTGSWADFTSAQFAEDSQSPDSSLDSKLTVPATFQESPSPALRADASSASASAPISFPGIEPLGRDVSVEKLIDLEQQAEFCVALGQDQEAIELLSSHVQATGGSSALPFLKLLEIFKRQGDQSSYAEWRERFSERFGVVPPGWEGDLSQGAGLEAYTSVMERIQDSWHDFGATMALLQRLLVPPEDDQTGLYMVASSLSLPAYQDLLLLYSVARDLSEHEVQGSDVDVFLPLEPSGSSPASTSMMATLPTPVAAHPGGLVDLHLDIDLSDAKH